MKLNFNSQNKALYVSITVAFILFVGAALRYPGFFSLGLISNLIDDNAFLGIAAVGMSFVILSGGIDLSVGSMVAVTGVMTALLVERLHLHPVIAFIVVIFFGSACGAFMGFLISFFEIAPFLVTLAGMFFLRGLAYTLSQESIALKHSFFQWILNQSVVIGTFRLQPTGLAFLLVIGLGIFVAGSTRWGRSVYAVGGNSLSSALMGLPVKHTIVGVYTVSGFLSALAGVVYAIYTSSGNATAAMGLELDVIAAVVIGGTLLTGGRGTIIGTFIGVFILGLIQTIISFEGTLSSWWTRILTGLLFSALVALQKILASLSTLRLFFKNTKWGEVILRNTCLVLAFVGLITVSKVFIAKANTQICHPGQGKGNRLDNGLYQMTGADIKPGQIVFENKELPDPAPPFINSLGQVEIFGSANHFIRYADWKSFSEGGCYDIIHLNLRSPKNFPYTETYTMPWDIRKFRVNGPNDQSTEMLLGGAMSASGDHDVPFWPDDNINRRIYIFRQNSIDSWIRDLSPLSSPLSSGWVGHSYGGNLIQEDAELNVIDPSLKNKIALFYEKVSVEKMNFPVNTELFAMELDSSLNPVPGTETKIFDVSSNYLSLRRTIGGLLAEGPRPVQVLIKGEKFFLVGFSSGDFPSDQYTLNFLWSRSLMGPYQPILNSDRSDLLDFGIKIKNRYNLSWLGRPSLFKTPDGEFEILFHAVRKDVIPENDYSRWPTQYHLWDFHRSIFKAKVTLDLNPQKEPIIILD